MCWGGGREGRALNPFLKKNIFFLLLLLGEGEWGAKKGVKNLGNIYDI